MDRAANRKRPDAQVGGAAFPGHAHVESERGTSKFECGAKGARMLAESVAKIRELPSCFPGQARSPGGTAGLASIPRIPRRPRKRDRVAYIGQPRDIRQRPLKAQTEACVRHGAVAAQVAVPGVVLLVD